MRKIFLIGFMGCGKSSFGRQLAKLCGWKFVDTDRAIERRTGLSVVEIFAAHGEKYFRELEEDVLTEFISFPEERCPQGGLVVALGGGTPCREGVMERLNDCGTTIYIRMSPTRLVKRLSPGARAKRPKIAGMDDTRLLKYIRNNLRKREMWYKKANFVVDLGGVPDGRVVELLKKLV